MNEDNNDKVVYAQPGYTQPFTQPFVQQAGAQKIDLPEEIQANPDTLPYTQEPPPLTQSQAYSQAFGPLPQDPPAFMQQMYGQSYIQAPYLQPQAPQPEAFTQPQAFPSQAPPPQAIQPQAPYTQQAPPPVPAQTPYVQGPYAGQAPYSGYGQPFVQTPPTQPFGSSPYKQFAESARQSEGQKRNKEKKRTKESSEARYGRRQTAVLAIVIVIACLASGIGGGMIGASLSQGEVISFDGGSVITIEPSNDITTTEAVAKKVLASVVGITTTGVYTNYYFFGEQEVVGVGTGMIIDAKGFILTNSHVVMDGSTGTISVLLSDGQEVDGELIWNDAGLDLAIVKIEANGLLPVEIGNSDEVAIGSYVAAIGNPLGHEFSGSITSGVVSGLDRTITVTDSYGGNPMTMQGLIQVDAAINHGNSGGPLLNSRGQVIGINTAKATAEGMGFAIPINAAVPVVEKVIRDGSFERVFMGVSAADVSVIKENYPNVEIMADKGACITDVSAGSPADKGGLKVKDVIIAIDDIEINGSNALIKLLLVYGSGDVIKVTFNRDGEIMETLVTLLSQSELEQVQQDENPFREPQRNNSGR